MMELPGLYFGVELGCIGFVIDRAAHVDRFFFRSHSFGQNAEWGYKLLAIFWMTSCPTVIYVLMSLRPDCKMGK